MESAIKQVTTFLEATDNREENWRARRPDAWVSLPDELIVAGGITQTSQLRATQCYYTGQRGILEGHGLRRWLIAHRMFSRLSIFGLTGILHAAGSHGTIEAMAVTPSKRLR